MKIYLATASTNDIAWGAAHGMLDGVITSPGLLAEDADAEMRVHLAELCRLVHGPIFASVHSVDGTNAVSHRRGNDIVVRRPCVGDPGVQHRAGASCGARWRIQRRHRPGSPRRRGT